MSITKTYTLKVDTDDAEKDLKGLKKGIEDVGSEVKETSGDTSALTGQLDKLTGGAISGFKKMSGSLKLVTTGFKSMRGAIISTGIGALIIGIVALTAAFTGSEEGQNKFNKIMTIIGALTGNLVDLLADLGEGIINTFTNPIESLKKFKKSVTEFVTDKINGVIDSFGILGGAIKKAFAGDFSGALKDAKKGFIKLNENINPTVMLVKAATKAVKEFAEEQVKEAKAAGKVADMRAKADKIERGLIVERSKLQSEIALLRLKSREEDKFTAEERKQALLDAQALEDTLLDKETTYLELRRDAQVLENTFSRSNKENLDKEAEAIAAVNRQVAARANTARQVQREVNTISKKIASDAKADAAAIKAIEDAKIAATKVRTDGIAKILDAARIAEQNALAVSEGEKLELERQRKVQELIDLDAHWTQIALISNGYTKRINAANLTSTEETNKKIKEDEQTLQDAKFKLAGDVLANISGIANLFAKGNEKNAKKAFLISKAVGMAQTGINTAQAIMKAASETTDGTPTQSLRTANMIAMGVAGAIQLAGIAAQKFQPGGGAANVPQPSAGGGGGAPQPPAFNVVGASGESQLADAIGGQMQRPARAYVVSNDVTSAQELDRNIIEGASI
tara:strand:+ start:5193 stop:7070 length:1878 start_codon:yes stop_codon:yes gene_type:complete